MSRGMVWLDTGTVDSLYGATECMRVMEKRTDKKIACIEEIAFLNKWIKKKEIKNQIKFYGNCNYSNYLKKVINQSV